MKKSKTDPAFAYAMKHVPSTQRTLMRISPGTLRNRLISAFEAGAKAVEGGQLREMKKNRDEWEAATRALGEALKALYKGGD